MGAEWGQAPVTREARVQAIAPVVAVATSMVMVERVQVLADKVEQEVMEQMMPVVVVLRVRVVVVVVPT